MSKRRQQPKDDRRKEYLIDGLAAFTNLIGWSVAVWSPVVVLIAIVAALFIKASAVTVSGIIGFLLVGLLFSAVGLGLIWFSRQLVARRFVRLGAAACLLLAALLVTLIICGTHRAAPRVANDLTWAGLLLIVGGPLITWRASTRESRS